MKTKRGDLVSHPNPEIGLTKREYFAAKALQGLLALSDSDYDYISQPPAVAVAFADDLINALNESKR